MHKKMLIHPDIMRARAYAEMVFIDARSDMHIYQCLHNMRLMIEIMEHPKVTKEQFFKAAFIFDGLVNNLKGTGHVVQ